MEPDAIILDPVVNAPPPPPPPPPRMMMRQGPIRLAFVTSTLRRCGPTNQLLGILRYLDHERFDASVITLSPEPPDSALAEFAALPVAIHPLGLGRSSVFRLLRRFAAALRSVRPHLVHTHGWRPDSLAATFRAGAAWVATARCIPHEEYPLRWGRLVGNRIADRHARTLGKCRHLVCCSNTVKRECEARYGTAAAAVVPDGTDLSPGAWGTRLERCSQTRYPLQVATACDLVPRKNVRHLCEIFTHVDSRFAALTVIGDGPERSRLAGYARENISFAGRRGDVHRHLASSAVFMSASRSEGLPNAVLEALSMGVPCLLSEIGPHRELKTAIPHGVDMFHLSDSPESVAGGLPARVERLLSTPPAAIRKAALEKYSAKKMSERYQALYADVCRPG